MEFLLFCNESEKFGDLRGNFGKFNYVSPKINFLFCLFLLTFGNLYSTIGSIKFFGGWSVRLIGVPPRSTLKDISKGIDDGDCRSQGERSVYNLLVRR